MGNRTELLDEEMSQKYAESVSAAWRRSIIYTVLSLCSIQAPEKKFTLQTENLNCEQLLLLPFLLSMARITHKQLRIQTLIKS